MNRITGFRAQGACPPVHVARKEEIERGNWKRINTSDLSKRDNEEYKKIFEERILNHLGVLWKKASDTRNWGS